jgi:hypothetical protein
MVIQLGARLVCWLVDWLITHEAIQWLIRMTSKAAKLQSHTAGATRN